MTAPEAGDFRPHTTVATPHLSLRLKMEGVEELRQQLKDAYEAYHDAREKKLQFLQNFQTTIMEIVIKQVSENFQTDVGEYFDMRNDHLHANLEAMDENLNQASMAHAEITDYRLQLLHACNDNIQPSFPAEEDTILVNGKGMEDLHSVSSEAEHQVMQVSELQEQACGLVSNHAQSITQMVDSLLSEAVTQMKRTDEGLLEEAELAWQGGEEELNKAVQVLESMEKVKQQIECLYQILGKPDN